MNLVLTRTYFPEGTNGKLFCDGDFMCYTIELPWKFNQRNVSCIPEGEYFISKRYSKKFKWHLVLLDVPQRSFILFHSANDAMRELNGCIAPVLKLSGPGVGYQSRLAFEKLKSLVYQTLDRGENVKLIINS